MRLTQKEFVRAYPIEFRHLPECYQDDSVLEFDVKTYGFASTKARSNVAWMVCYPKKKHESALGEWRASFTWEKGWMVTTPRKLDNREYVHAERHSW